MNDINTKLLEETVAKIMAKGKGILAADESNGTADKRLETYGILGGEEMRRQYRELFFGTEGIEDFISGVILYDETFWQVCDSGETFPELLNKKGIVPGIKIDEGAKDFPGFPGEKLTIGLDDSKERAKNYFDNGAKFTKWRAVIAIDEKNNLPTDNCIEENMENLARYARIVQEIGLVPIVEPEVLLNGPHSIQKSQEVTERVLKTLFKKLEEFKVYIPGLILKTSMIINGDQNPNESSAEEVAEKTIETLLSSVPKNIGDVVFLSGGQTAVEATAHLDKMSEIEREKGLPFEIAFSYARAIQDPVLRAWQGKKENIPAAREQFKNRLGLNQLADSGDYDINLEYLD